MKTTFKMDLPYRYSKRDYECAAWWELHEAAPGTFEAEFVPRTINSTGAIDPLTSGFWRVLMPATVIDDFFPALFCGVSISKTPYKCQHLGEPRTIKLLFPIDQFVRDARFLVTPETYSELAELALAELSKDFNWQNGLLHGTHSWMTNDRDRPVTSIETKRNDPHGRWCGYKNHLKQVLDVVERIDQVVTFREWHKNTYGYKQPHDYKWHGYVEQHTLSR